MNVALTFKVWKFQVLKKEETSMFLYCILELKWTFGCAILKSEAMLNFAVAKVKYPLKRYKAREVMNMEVAQYERGIIPIYVL